MIISTADFQHALLLADAVRAGRDAYCEKPFAETMADARAALKAVRETGKIVQIGSQRRSGSNYIAAYEYLKSGKFGPITAVEMTWNVNQPGRWRRPKLVAAIREADTDWKRYLLNRPYEPWDPRKYLEYRLFWPYSSGIPGQWMCHQIDTVHWFTGLPHPRSVAANGGIYVWKDGRKNADTLTAVLDYGPARRSVVGLPGRLFLADAQLRRRREGILLLQRRQARPGQEHRDARGRDERGRGRRDGHEAEPPGRVQAARGPGGNGGVDGRRSDDGHAHAELDGVRPVAARLRTPTSRPATTTPSPAS